MACRSSTPISADRVTTTEENAVLTHPILDQLSQLGLSGMAQAFAELEASDETAALPHSDWLGLLVDRAHSSPRQAAGRPAALRQTAPAGQHRGRRLPGPTRPRPRSVTQAHQWRVDRRA